jgi:hypothetical protein
MPRPLAPRQALAQTVLNRKVNTRKRLRRLFELASHVHRPLNHGEAPDALSSLYKTEVDEPLHAYFQKPRKKFGADCALRASGIFHRTSVSLQQLFADTASMAGLICRIWQ